jgi:hypothetical protein
MDETEEKLLLSQIPKSPPPRFKAKSVSSVLDRLIEEKGYANEQSTQIICDVWRAAVGDEMFNQSRVGKVKRGVLQIIVLNSIILSELEYSKPKALQQFQVAIPQFKIKSIRFKLITQ